VSGYEVDGFYDEAFETDGRPRPHYGAVMAALDRADLDAVAKSLGDQAEQRGVRYGEGRFRIDPVPRVLTADEWRALEAGIGQRVRALDAFVADLYGERAIADGPLPAHVLEGVNHYEPDMQGALVQAGVRAGLAGLDIARGDDGAFRVLEDNTRTPTGFAYTGAARTLRERHLPIGGPAPVEVRARSLEIVGETLRAAAPDGHGDPSIVLLSDGPENDAWYEQRATALELGIPLVTLADLESRGGRLQAHVESGVEAVDVVYRRTDEHRLRDEHGRPTALSDALLEPIRRGTVAVVNAFGAGVADDKLVHAYVEEIVRFYLDEEPLLASVPTLDPGVPEALEEALERLDELVLKPRTRAGGAGIVIGPHARADDLDHARQALRERPGDYVAQEQVALSRHPTVVDGGLEPRHVDLRALVGLAGGRALVVPGGLTRLAVEADDLMVNMTQGGGIKDTWVLPES